MATKRKKIDSVGNVQAKLERLLNLHGGWEVGSRKQIEGWMKRVNELRIKSEFAEHPVIKSFIEHKRKSVRDINSVLLNKYDLPTEKSDILKDKRDMYIKDLAILVPDENMISEIERTVDYQLSDNTL